MNIEDMAIVKRLGKDNRKKWPFYVFMPVGMTILLVLYALVSGGQAIGVWWAVLIGLIGGLSINLLFFILLFANKHLKDKYDYRSLLPKFSSDELQKMDKECCDYFSVADKDCCLTVPTQRVLFAHEIKVFPMEWHLSARSSTVLFAVPMEEVDGMKITKHRTRIRRRTMPKFYFTVEIFTKGEGDIVLNTIGFSPFEFKERMNALCPTAEIDMGNCTAPI
ncbi:MAG: hypothetical protein FWF49_05065 [Oscillospiraceae bacterium]|nr:hypothetical protein [Oscillospiraceae bacterium]